MIIRFAVRNLLSFNEETEFNTLPARISRLNHHIYEKENAKVLKLAAIYGANGAGKSNLIESIFLIKRFVVNGEFPSRMKNSKFKLSKDNEDKETYLGIEFIKNNKPFYYGVKTLRGIITEEELYLSGLGIKEDEILFARNSSDENEISRVSFFKEFSNNDENVALRKVIEKDLLKKQKSLFKLLSELTNESLSLIHEAFSWFEDNLNIVFPDSKPTGLAHKVAIEEKFREFADDLMKSYSIGIAGLRTEIKPIEEFLEEEYDKKEVKDIIAEMKEDPKKVLALRNPDEEAIATNEDGKIIVHRLVLEHRGKRNETATFHLNEESDGTKRLLEYLPALNDTIYSEEVYIVDEIERSIHPLIIKELISKFSRDKKTKGQLIFSTHESNLLDQEFLRTDEIWLTEKNKFGETKLYPLSDFKEHHTIDIRKGYLNGRYGAIPFLGNLHDLNWDKYAEA